MTSFRTSVTARSKARPRDQGTMNRKKTPKIDANMKKLLTLSMTSTLRGRMVK
jgi:hypothetical protein